MQTEPIAVTLTVIEALERLGAPYFIGGSLASAVHGVVRATMDADVVAEMREEHAAPFAQALSGAFYVDEDAARRAIQHQSSFNVIHFATSFKVDIFVSKRRPFDQSRFARRVTQAVATEPERTAFVSSAEDTILAKLEWYRLGGEVSERQWRDVLGMMQAQAGQMDTDYLWQWATALGVADLLERALSESMGESHDN